ENGPMQLEEIERQGLFLQRMAIGHLALGASETAPVFLYLSLALIVCGSGLFNSTASGRLGERSEPADPRRAGGCSL
ncbi:hypothetical protein Q6265_30970, partial [Klebsiella pneumoniae]|nr:hypothetical protein [Klebsiella pneumoniae]